MKFVKPNKDEQLTWLTWCVIGYYDGGGLVLDHSVHFFETKDMALDFADSNEFDYAFVIVAEVKLVSEKEQNDDEI